MIRETFHLFKSMKCLSFCFATACQKPCDLGYAAELWTLAALHKHIQAHAEEVGYPRLKTVTKSWLQKYLKKMDIKPFKIKYYLERKDPDFENKMPKAELSERIYRYFNEINAEPIIYHWTYKMDEINPDEIAAI